MGYVFTLHVIFVLAGLIFSVWGWEQSLSLFVFSSISSHLRQLQHSWANMLACKCFSIQSSHCEESVRESTEKLITIDESNLHHIQTLFTNLDQNKTLMVNYSLLSGLF
jgi:hypothetical protein